MVEAMIFNKKFWEELIACPPLLLSVEIYLC
jgi:hypothetical protein